MCLPHLKITVGNVYPLVYFSVISNCPEAAYVNNMIFLILIRTFAFMFPIFCKLSTFHSLQGVITFHFFFLTYYVYYKVNPFNV